VNVVAQQAADLLEKAIALLEIKGWCTGHLDQPITGAHCAIGALQMASVNRAIAGFDTDSLEWRKQPEIALALQALARPGITGSKYAADEDATSNWQRIVMWNNSQQTAEPVIDGMRRAAKELANNA
jgi:hypothetical protein